MSCVQWRGRTLEARSFISASLFTGNTHVQTSLPGVALSRGGREELRGVHVTRWQFCQVSAELFTCREVFVTLAASRPWKGPGSMSAWSECAPQWSHHSCDDIYFLKDGAEEEQLFSFYNLCACVFQRAVVQRHHERLQQSARLPRQELQIPRAFHSKCPFTGVFCVVLWSGAARAPPEKSRCLAASWGSVRCLLLHTHKHTHRRVRLVGLN